MTSLTLKDLSKKMKELDFAMLSTRTEGGSIASRPMSNNQDVEYDGDSWFFTIEDTRTVRDLMDDPSVELGFVGSRGLLGKPGIFLFVQGEGELIRDKTRFHSHWTKDLDRWFSEGVDTPGLVLLKVHANRIHYWDGEDEGEITIRR